MGTPRRSRLSPWRLRVRLPRSPPRSPLRSGIESVITDAIKRQARQAPSQREEPGSRVVSAVLLNTSSNRGVQQMVNRSPLFFLSHHGIIAWRNCHVFQNRLNPFYCSAYKSLFDDNCASVREWNGYCTYQKRADDEPLKGRK